MYEAIGALKMEVSPLVMTGYWAASQVEAKSSAPTDFRNPDHSQQQKRAIFLNCKSEDVKTEELKTVEMCAQFGVNGDFM
jgi:hypothetical protein